MPRLVFFSRSLRRALAISALVHAVLLLIASVAVPSRTAGGELVDIELAPPPPAAEALPAEHVEPVRPEPAPPPEEPVPPESASTPPSEPGELAADAGVDAAVDARRPDAMIDAAIDAAVDASPDAGVDAEVVAVADDAGVADGAAEEPSSESIAAATADAAPADAMIADAGNAVASASVDGGTSPLVVANGAPAPVGRDAAGSAGSGSAVPSAGSGSAAAVTGNGSAARLPLDTAALVAALAARTGAPGATDEPAVDGAPTTAGTAANLLAYMPTGHILAALIRFDRLRGTEWAAQTERLLQPLPDYQWLFGGQATQLTDKLDTLIISTPRPRDAAATTLVVRTQLPRRQLRDLLGQASPVAWSAAVGGTLGRRTGKLFPGDQRVFLSPFKGWFLLAQPADLGGLTKPVAGDPDAALAPTGPSAAAAIPAWLAGIRTIEAETGETKGPAVVATFAPTGKRQRLTDPGYGFGPGISSIPLPERLSIAAELVAQGWLIRGNVRCRSDADAAELVSSIQRIQSYVVGSFAAQLLIGKPYAHVLANLAVVRQGPRISYATSASIADSRAILAAAAQQLDGLFGRAP